jgi:hypothetical protein
MGIERSFRISYEPVKVTLKTIGIGIETPLYIFSGPVDSAESKINDKLIKSINSLLPKSPEIRNLWEIRLSPTETGEDSLRIGKINLFLPANLEKDRDKIKINVNLNSPRGLGFSWETLWSRKTDFNPFKENLLLGIAHAGNKLEKFSKQHEIPSFQYLPLTVQLTTNTLNFSVEKMLRKSIRGVYRFYMDKKFISYIPQESHRSITSGKLYYR